MLKIISTMLMVTISTELLILVVYPVVVQCWSSINEPPKITLVPKSRKVLEGRMVTFMCKASGNPMPEITWSHSQKKIVASSSYHNNKRIISHPYLSVLRVEPVRKKDEGMYECEAQNDVGSPEKVSFNLSVYGKSDPVPPGFPVITVQPVLGSVDRYRNTVMQCGAKGNPEPEFTWLKDLVPIEISHVRYSVMPTGALQLLNSTEMYEGKFECIAENNHGMINSQQATLIVKARQIPPYFSATPDNVEVVPGGSVLLTCIANGTPLPHIIWKKEDIEISDTRNHSNGKGVLHLSDIRESANYTCHAISELGAVSHVVEVKVKAFPKPPTSVLITEVSPSSVRLAWNSGNTEPVESYIIQFRAKYTQTAENYSEIGDIPQSEYSIYTLSAYTEYEFKVIAVNRVGRSPASSPVDVTTGELIPGSPPINVRARAVSSSTVVVQWEEPKICNGIVKGYKVYYTHGPADMAVNLWTLHHVENSQLTTLTNLMKNRTYTICVLAFTGVGDGPLSERVQVITRPGVPNQPTNFLGEAISPTSIQLQWDRPEISANEMIRYRLRYTDSNTRSNLSINITPMQDDQHIRHLLNDLTPNTVYHMTLSAVSEKGEGPPTATIQLQTHPYALTSSPLFVSGKALNSTSIQVSWKPPTQDTTIDGYIVSFSETRNFEDDSPLWSVNLTSDLTSVALEDLDKFVAYKVWVAAYNTAGRGPLSDVIIVKTEEDVPGEPKKVKVEALNSTAVKVDWRPPHDKEHNGDIKGYFVYHTELDDNGEERYSAIKSESQNSHQTEYLVGGLKPATYYHFQVCAFTRRGEGDKSKPRKMKTKHAVPSPPRGFTLSLMKEEHPGNPGVVVTWQTPKFPHGQIEGYLVAFGVRGESHVEERRFSGDVYRFTTSFLERGSTYEFKIAAKNAVGYGEYATEVIKTPEGIPSGSPINFTIAVLGPHSMHLQWDPPVKKHRHGDIQLYELVYCESEDPGQDIMVNTTERNYIVDKLDPDRAYTFLLRAYTGVGGGPWTSRVIKKTFNSYTLPAPINVRLRQISPTSLEVTWDEFYGRNPTNVQIIGYRIYYSSLPNANIEKWPSIETRPGTSNLIQGLEPSTTYAVKVRAKGNDGRYGNLSDAVISNRFDSERPETVSGFFARTHISGPVVLEWKPPRKPGVSRYKLEYMGIRKSRDFTGMEDTTVDPRKEMNLQKEKISWTIEDLMPKTLYTFNLSANFIDGSWGPPNIIQVETNSDASALEAPFYIRPLSDHMVSVKLRPVAETLGKALQYLLVVLPTDSADQKSSDEFSNEELYEGSAKKGWIAAQFDGSSLPQEVIIGDGKRSGNGDVFNRPLPKGQNYVAFLRAILANHKYISSPYSRHLLQDLVYPVVMPQHRQSIDLLWIVAPICAAVVLILLLILIIIIARKRRVSDKSIAIAPNKVLMAAGSNDIPSCLVDPVDIRRMQYQSPAMISHPPIPVNDLTYHIEALKANDNVRFSLEYESIDPGQQFTWEASSLEVNKSKNRYANVIAYDHSRVVLRPLPQASSTYSAQGQTIQGSDFINANYLDGFRKQNSYIATQGPMTETFSDFWRMVWEKQCSTIVMMTKLEERGRVKCDQYWPSRGSEMYGSLQVTLVDVMELATYTIRTFQLSSEFSPDKREVRHFQFTAWPDYGVPDHPAPLLLFMRRVKFMTPSDSGPATVHCSAGVGRTGVFVVLDSMLERIKHTGTVDIYGHVTCLRAQRNYMVQTEDQYIFIHTAVLEAVTSGNTEVPARNLFVHMQRLLEPVTVTNQAGLSTTMTGMEAEFKKLSSGKTSLSLFASANLSCNKQKNRLVNVLPFESTRVCLQPIRGVDGSDYINGNFIDGYRYRKAYLATQGPLPDTVEDFWRAMWECNCNIVVMLTKLRENSREMCHQYWPSERSARYQYFVVDPLAEYNMPQYILREFKVTDARDGQSRTVRQFQLTDWPEQGVPSTGDGFIEFIGQVHKTKEQFGQEGPIGVHCSAGVGRSGVFITLSIVLERMRFEGVVDMFQTVNILRTQRPGMVQTEEQYAFCYRAALEYLGSFDHYTN